MELRIYCRLLGLNFYVFIYIWSNFYKFWNGTLAGEMFNIWVAELVQNIDNILESSLVTIFLLLNLLIGWQLSIWICCKPFLSMLYNCQLLCFRRLALSIVVEVFPRLFFFQNTAPSRMFTTNSLCLIVCPIHEWDLFF